MSFTAARELPPKALKEDAALIWLVGCTKTAVKPLTSDRYARELVNEEDVSTEVAAVEGIADSRALVSICRERESVNGEEQVWYHEDVA